MTNIRRSVVVSLTPPRRLALFVLVFAMVIPLLRGLAQDSYDQEKILFYGSEIDVDSTGLVYVTETIRVRALSVDIKRGIYRTIPTIYKGKFMETVVIPLNVTRVLRDGHAEEYFVEEVDNGVRIYIGRENYELPPGEYTYTIAYSVDRQIGFFADYDELYWNVTGLEWSFAIDSVSAVVMLPEGGQILRDKLSAYSGASGEAGCSCQVLPESERSVTFRTTAPLNSYEGLTIAVPFRKGLIREPTRDELVDRFLTDNPAGIAALAGLAIVLAYYVIAWLFVGKDPKGQTIVPRFEPPANLAPHELRYVKRMSFDNKAMVACLVWLAQKGHLTIEETDRGTYTLTRVKGDNQKPGDVERAILGKLFANAPSITLSNTYNPSFGAVLTYLRNYLEKNLNNFAFRLNRRWAVFGILLSVVVMVVSCLLHPFNQAATGMFMVIWISGWTAACLFMVKACVHFVRERKYIMTAVLSVFVTPFLAAEVFVLYLLFDIINFYAYVSFLLLWTLNVVFFGLMKAPTLAGRRLLDEIESFSLFLRTAEMPRIQTLTTTPAMDLRLFEQYLPYALALDLQTEWAKHFESHLSAPNQTNSFHWYRGISTSRSLGEFSSSFGRSLSSSISSSSTPPGSKSGSSGGGSSGGGGGGGGGGGW